MLVIPSTISAPSTITVRFLSPALSFDLTAVTGVSFNVLRRDGTTTTFAATIVSATRAELVAQYAFQGGEVTATGAYSLAPVLAVPGGSIPAETVTMMVVSPFKSLPKVEDESWLMTSSAVESAVISPAWRILTLGPVVASPFSPFIALDLRGAPLDVTLWQANDGDIAILSDVYAAASIRNLTLRGTSGQLVPTGTPGVYGASGTFATDGFILRLKYAKAATAWFPW